MPAAIDVNWDVLRIEFSHGATLEELAEKHNIKVGTLYARSAREKWMELRPESHARTLQASAKEAARSQGATLVQRGQAYADRVFTKVSRLVEEANLPAPKNWKDMETADRVARRAAGLDNSEVTVNTLVSIGGMDEGEILPVIEGDFAQISDSDPSPSDESADS